MKFKIKCLTALVSLALLAGSASAGNLCYLGLPGMGCSNAVSGKADSTGNTWVGAQPAQPSAPWMPSGTGFNNIPWTASFKGVSVAIQIDGCGMARLSINPNDGLSYSYQTTGSMGGNYGPAPSGLGAAPVLISPVGNYCAVNFQPVYATPQDAMNNINPTGIAAMPLGSSNPTAMTGTSPMSVVNIYQPPNGVYTYGSWSYLIISSPAENDSASGYAHTWTGRNKAPYAFVLYGSGSYMPMTANAPYQPPTGDGGGGR